MIESSKVLFVINPNSGRRKKIDISEIIKKEVDPSVNFKIIYWESSEQDIVKIIKELIEKENFDFVFAVGGDGTVNKVASALINKNVVLGIIPIGSGNGLARHLKIPLDIKKSLYLLNKAKYIEIDTCYINNKPYFITSGVGFDAHIGKLFANSKSRGFYSYLKITISELFKYKSQQYHLTIDDKEINIKAFLITFANANQYGNNVIIAPNADIQDGIIEVTVIKPFNIFQAIAIAFRLFNHSINKSSAVETFKGKKIKLIRTGNLSVHYDGEPDKLSEMLTIDNQTRSIKVLV
jgi:YegS/Rv2252/BmrU family lipid kinase